MNQLCNFRKCTLSTQEIIDKVDDMTDKMFKTGVIPTRHIPARPNEDFDLLIGELLLRINEIREICNEQ